MCSQVLTGQDGAAEFKFSGKFRSALKEWLHYGIILIMHVFVVSLIVVLCLSKVFSLQLKKVGGDNSDPSDDERSSFDGFYDGEEDFDLMNLLDTPVHSEEKLDGTDSLQTPIGFFNLYGDSFTTSPGGIVNANDFKSPEDNSKLSSVDNVPSLYDYVTKSIKSWKDKDDDYSKLFLEMCRSLAREEMTDMVIRGIALHLEQDSELKERFRNGGEDFNDFAIIAALLRALKIRNVEHYPEFKKAFGDLVVRDYIEDIFPHDTSDSMAARSNQLQSLNDAQKNTLAEWIFNIYFSWRDSKNIKRNLFISAMQQLSTIYYQRPKTRLRWKYFSEQFASNEKVQQCLWQRDKFEYCFAKFLLEGLVQEDPTFVNEIQKVKEAASGDPFPKPRRNSLNP